MDVIITFVTDLMPIDGNAALAVVETNMGIEMFVAVADEYGDLKFPDTGDDIGWTINDVKMWADLSNIPNDNQEFNKD